MRRTLTGLLLLALAVAPSAARGQQGDLDYFASFEGLQRVVARSWIMPLSPMTATPGATPPASPSASPVAGGEITSLSIFVHLFDTDADAATAYERIDDELRETSEKDAHAPMDEELALDGIGDRAHGYMGTLDRGDTGLVHTFATVHDGPYVYSVTGTFTGSGADDATREVARTLVSTPVDRMAEQFDQGGGSRGGLWGKLNAVQPEMAAGVVVTDFQIYPLIETA